MDPSRNKRGLRFYSKRGSFDQKCEDRSSDLKRPQTNVTRGDQSNKIGHGVRQSTFELVRSLQKLVTQRCLMHIHPKA